MQLPQAIAEVLDQAIAEAHELAQFLGGRVRHAGRRRPLLRAEAGEAQRVDRVGFGAHEILAGQAVRAQRIE